MLLPEAQTLPSRFLQMTGYSAEEVLGHNW